MTQCTECRILETSPHCAEVPKRLKSFTVRDKLFGLKYITGYECRKCGSLWRWHASESWVFIAAPRSRMPVTATPDRRAPAVHQHPAAYTTAPAMAAAGG